MEKLEQIESHQKQINTNPLNCSSYNQTLKFHLIIAVKSNLITAIKILILKTWLVPKSRTKLLKRTERSDG